MQVSKVAVSNPYSVSKNQKSPAFGDRITVLTRKCPDIKGTMSVLRDQTGIPGHVLNIEIGDVTSALTCEGEHASKLAEYFLSLSLDIKRALGLNYEGNALRPMMAARKNSHSSSVTSDSQLAVPVVQRFPMAEFIPKWSKASA